MYTDQYITVNAVLTPVVQTGYLDISSSPSGANVYVDGIYKGTSPLVASVDAGSHTIRMEKPGYDTWYGTYRVSSGETAQVYASLGPSVTYGYINVHSTPSGANVYVDGTYRDNTPEVISVTAGTAHEVQIVYSGYEVYRQTVTVSTGSTVYLDANLVTSSDAYLKIASSPSGGSGVCGRQLLRQHRLLFGMFDELYEYWSAYGRDACGYAETGQLQHLHHDRDVVSQRDPHHECNPDSEFTDTVG